MNEPVDRSMRAYYAARAPEYDEWYDRVGRCDRGPANAEWNADLAELTAWVESLRAGHVLDIACGTGRWTQRLTKHNRVTACDFSQEMLAQCAAGTPGIAQVQADAYHLPFASGTFDAVFFGFWLGHVFPERIDPFVAEVERVVRPGGEVWVCDSGWSRDSGAQDHDPPPALHSGGVHRRILNDGRTFDIYKQCFTAAVLAEYLSAWGPRPETHESREHFVWGRVRRPSG